MTNNGMFDKHKFHDCMIHDMRFIIEEWERSFVLDIDYIINGPINDDPPFYFRLTRGVIYFYDVQDIIIDIDSNRYKHTYNISNPIILKIEELNISSDINGKKYYKWRIDTTDESDFIHIVASKISFYQCKDSIVVDRQNLYSSERDMMICNQ